MRFDLAILGSGFGGALLAQVTRRLGRSVALLEKGRHPRFAIGESSTPLANLLLDEIATRYDLPRLRPFTRWGAWQRAHPEIPVGLKRGFTFYHHRAGHPFACDPERRDQLLVAASPRDDVADTHWFRAAFDEFLAREAEALGAVHLEHSTVQSIRFDGSGAELELRHAGRDRVIRAALVVDASGGRGLLSRLLGLRELALPHLPSTQALFTHFEQVARLDGLPIHPGVAAAPYPVDDAAVHHVFKGGWIWVLRFNHGVTSAGVAATDALARELNLAEGAPAWDRLLGRLPTVAAQFAPADAVRPFVYAPAPAFRLEPAAGPGWVLLPSAAGFVDPLLSSGFTLNLLGILRLGEAIERAWGRPGFEAALAAHACATAAELLAVERFVAALYANFADFPAFSEIARLYFCAVIFCETARRLGRPEAAGGLLMHAHREFGPRAAAACQAALRRPGEAALRAHIEPCLERFDLAGLGRAERRNWFPVNPDDLRDARGKIGATSAQIEDLLVRSGHARPVAAPAHERGLG